MSIENVNEIIPFGNNQVGHQMGVPGHLFSNMFSRAPTVDSSWAEVRQADIAEYAHIPNAGELTMRQSQSTEKDRLWARIDTARGTTAPSLITNDEL